MRPRDEPALAHRRHRHEAEVLQSWREWIGRPDADARLMTHSGPFVRGIYLTLHAYLPRDECQRRRPGHRGGGVVPRGLRGRPFVRVLDAPPELTHAVGTNYALIHAVESADGREIQVTSRSTTWSRAPAARPFRR